MVSSSWALHPVCCLAGCVCVAVHSCVAVVPDFALLHCVAALYVLMDESGVGVFLTRIKNCFTAMLGDFQVKAL